MVSIMEKFIPPFVQFEQREMGMDEVETAKQGIPVVKIVNMALVTPMGSKDVVEKVAEEWLEQIEKNALDDRCFNRFPFDWIQKIKHAYGEWKKGNTIPEDGIPIRGWPALSKTEQLQVLRANFLTVEQLSAANESALSIIGMGGRYYRDKARAYLDEAKGTVNATKIANLEAENRDLKESLDRQAQKLKELEQAFTGQKDFAKRK
jgi:hypothetical protein